ncbi:MAG: replicative DNA helicase [Treponema sp.]|nr:replicative DNA helicase [Treponema sp.]
MDYNLLNKVPPHSLEAEQAVLGAVLLDWTAMSELVSRMRPEHFYSIQNQTIFQALLKLFNKNVKGDTLSLINELTVEQNLEKAGGTAYIASLTDTVPSSANIDYYSDIVLDRSVRRELINVSTEMRSLAYELGQDSSSLLDHAEQKIFSLAERNESTVIHEIKNIMIREIEIIDSRYKNQNQFTGVPSGFSQLDTMTSGFQKSELIIIGARPSIGKTALALSMMRHIALERKISCGFFSLEMPYESIGMRLLSMEANVNMGRMRSGMIRKEDIMKIQDAAGRWFESPLYTVDTPNMRLLDLKAMARRMVKNHKVEIIFIDYIGLITTENTSAPVYEQVSEISKALKALARELEIPVVALCQVARDAEGKEPNLAQLRGSGSIEQDADVVMFIDRDRLKDGLKSEEKNAVQKAKIILAKQRNGPTGDINISFIPAYSVFSNLVQDDK